jgi:hypothetical protein
MASVRMGSVAAALVPARACAYSSACAQSQLCSGFPVNPGGILLGAVHGIDGAHDGFPIAASECGTRFPNEQIVIQVLIARHFVEVTVGVVLQFLRGLFANHGPNPVVLFFGEHQAPFFFELLCGFVGVGVGNANEGQDGEFFAFLGDGQDVLVQIFLRVRVNQDGLFAEFARFNVERQLGNARAVVVHGQAGFAPHIECVNFFQVVQFVCRVGASVFSVSEGIPKAFELGNGFRFGEQWLGCQGVATHLSVVVHAKAWVLLREDGPVTLSAQLQQPIVAQTIFGIGACVLRQKLLNFGVTGLV